MANLSGFDARTVEPADSFDPLPAGDYLAKIIKSEMKPTKDRTGEYLELTFQVLEGPYKGRQVWARLNLVNRNETAVRIAKGELSAICRAVGVMTPRDSQELHNLPLEIKVTCKKREDNGEISNEVKGYRRRGGGAAAQPTYPQQQPQQPQQQPAAVAAGMPAAGPPEPAHPLAAPASYPKDASGRPIDENGDIAPWA